MMNVLLRFAILAGTVGVPLLADTAFYNNLPNPIPQSSFSWGFQSAHTSQFGDLVQLAAGPATLTKAVIVMNDHAQFSIWSGFPGATAAGWQWRITLNLYNIVMVSGTPQPGSLITTVTQTFQIPWQPPAAAGQEFPITFNLPNVAVPAQFIFGIVYNTKTFGPNPTNDPNDGPYSSLNVALTGGFTSTPPPQVGTLPYPDTAYLNANDPGYYCGSGVGFGSFVQDTDWQTAPPTGCGFFSISAEFLGQDADLSISMTETTSFSSTFLFTITVTNNGPGQSTSVVVTDPTPAGLTFVSNTGACTGAFPCNLGTLNSGQSVTIVSTYSSAPVAGSHINTATVSSFTNDPNLANNTATSSTLPPTPAPSSLSLVGLGLAAVLLWNSRRYVGAFLRRYAPRG
jgi:uncharacterized repeat protein (TIGR01451 family)